MPQALAAAIVAAVGLTGTAAAIASAVISLAITVGLNFIAMAIFGGQGVGKPSDGQRVQRINVGSRVRHYGTVKVAGQLTFYESRAGTLYTLVTTGQGRIAGIIGYELNGKPVTVNGAGLVTDARFKGAVSIHHRLGTDSQTAYAQLTGVFTEWTTAHRQRGCSSVLVVARPVKQKDFAEVYEGSREPEPTVILETSLVYDPRKDSTAIIGRDGEGDPVMGSGSHRLNDPATWEFSDNWALCFADYLAHPDGYGLGYAMINWENVAQEAAICDEVVSTYGGGTTKRWRACGSYRLATDERRAVVREFLKAGDGFLWQDANGLANIRCGRWIAPTVHIPEKHIKGCTASLGTDPQDRANEVRVIYTEPALNYVETEAAPIVNEADQLALGRAEVSRFDAYYCPHHNQAARIGKRIAARIGERWAITMTCNLFGLNAIGERFITTTITELGIIDLSFEVTSLKIDLASLSVELGLLEAKEEDFSFDAATEEGVPPNNIPATGAPVEIETPDGFDREPGTISLSNGSAVELRASWNEPARPDLIAEVEYQPVGSDEWFPMAVDNDNRVATSGAISAGQEYRVRSRFVTIGGRPSDWVEPDPIELIIDETAPSAPTVPGVTPSAGEAEVTWRNPPEANFGFVRIYRATVNDFSSAVAVDDVAGGILAFGSYVDTPLAADDYWWWFVSYNSTGTLFSAPAGPVSGTVI